MDLEKLKEYLQNYLDTIITPKLNERREEKGQEPMNFSVFKVIKGSFEPTIIHVFLDSEPIIKRTWGLKPEATMMLAGVEVDIIQFFKIFSITNKVKVHWNKRPLFNNATLSADH